MGDSSFPKEVLILNKKRKAFGEHRTLEAKFVDNPDTNPRPKRLKLWARNRKAINVGLFAERHLDCTNCTNNTQNCESFQKPFDEDRDSQGSLDLCQIENDFESLFDSADAFEPNLGRASDSDFDTDIDIDFISDFDDNDFSSEVRGNQDCWRRLESNRNKFACRHDISKERIPSVTESRKEQQRQKTTPIATGVYPLDPASSMNKAQQEHEPEFETFPSIVFGKMESSTSMQTNPGEARQKLQPDRAKPKTQSSDEERVERSLKECTCGGKCKLNGKRLKWHCNGTKRTYLNTTCTKCQGEWIVCPNNNCTNVLKWNEDDNVVCTVCQLNNRSDRKAGKEKIRWRWHRCGAKNCKAMYVFNRGRRLKRSADKCGLLQMKKKYHKP